VTRKEIYRLLGKHTRDQKHALRESMGADLRSSAGA
jgi:hypothetical protein